MEAVQYLLYLVVDLIDVGNPRVHLNVGLFIVLELTDLIVFLILLFVQKTIFHLLDLVKNGPLIFLDAIFVKGFFPSTDVVVTSYILLPSSTHILHLFERLRFCRVEVLTVVSLQTQAVLFGIVMEAEARTVFSLVGGSIIFLFDFLNPHVGPSVPGVFVG